MLHLVPLDSVSLNSLSSGSICFQKSLYITLIHQIPSTWSIEDTILNGGSAISADTASSQFDIELSKLTWEPSSFKIFQKKFLKSSNSIRFLSASSKFWLHWSLSPYKRKYAEYFAFWILEALQKTNTPNFHKFKANYLSKRGLKWLTQILSCFSPKNEGSVAPISIRK